MSSRATFYAQSCPTCGRHLQVCVEYLGRRIQCRHCRAVFVARDPGSVPSDATGEDLLHPSGRTAGTQRFGRSGSSLILIAAKRLRVIASNSSLNCTKSRFSACQINR